MKNFRKLIVKIVILNLILFFTFIVKANAFTIVLDPGHGGKDSGAYNKSKGIKEETVNYKIATYLYAYLNKYKGVNVYITRSQFKLKTLQERANVAIDNNADLLFSIHINASDSGKPTGACAYVTYKNDLPKYNKNCTQLSKIVLNNLNKLGIKNNGVKTRICKEKKLAWMYADGSHADYYGIIRYCMKGTKGDGIENELNILQGESIPAVLIEH